MTQTVKNLPVNSGDPGQYLGGEDALEKGMSTHSSILAWRIPWTEESGGLWFIGLQRVRHNQSDLVCRHACFMKPPLKSQNDRVWRPSELVNMWRCEERGALRAQKLGAPSHILCLTQLYMTQFLSFILKQ